MRGRVGRDLEPVRPVGMPADKNAVEPAGIVRLGRGAQIAWIDPRPPWRGGFRDFCSRGWIIPMNSSSLMSIIPFRSQAASAAGCTPSSASSRVRRAERIADGRVGRGRGRSMATSAAIRPCDSTSAQVGQQHRLVHIMRHQQCGGRMGAPPQIGHQPVHAHAGPARPVPRTRARPAATVSATAPAPLPGRRAAPRRRKALPARHPDAAAIPPRATPPRPGRACRHPPAPKRYALRHTCFQGSSRGS